ncbi:hypothetical protein GCM10010406_26700 [Streptomyces thermolineatus]|uniref:HTH cro/C1-type domain-containing protein n=2 Tax=Streptomyces thermolineatus TaxID=44033 RepID=A0ABP5YYP2_9ACTN
MQKLAGWVTIVNMASLNVGNVGEYLREQRRNAQLSLRQLADAAGVSNPYLSQIERGLRKPSAEILQQLAKALRISAETLYVQAGILDERDRQGEGVRQAVMGDPVLNERQKQVLLQIYESFRKENGGPGEGAATEPGLAPAGTGGTAGGTADGGAAEGGAADDGAAAPKAVRRRSPRAARQPGDGRSGERTTAKKAAKKAARGVAKSAAAKVAGTVAGRSARTGRQLEAVPDVPDVPDVRTAPAASGDPADGGDDTAATA